MLSVFGLLRIYIRNVAISRSIPVGSNPTAELFRDGLCTVTTWKILMIQKRKIFLHKCTRGVGSLVNVVSVLADVKMQTSFASLTV